MAEATIRVPQMTRQEKIDKCDAELVRAYQAWKEAVTIATDDPEPQADDEETIRALAKAKDILSKRTYIENDVFIMHALNAALTRLSAPVGVQTKAEAVVRDFCFGTKRLYEDERKELPRLIVEQFKPAPKAKE
jgi:hypothetical protein